METLAVHAGLGPDPQTGAVVEPITLAVSFERDPDGGHRRGYHYSSAGNPNRMSLEKGLAALEGGTGAVAYASGSAAISAVLGTVPAGDHIVIPDDVFQGTVRLLTESLSRWGVTFSTVDMTDRRAVRSALRPRTRLIWTEGLSNPLLKVTDLEAIAAIAHDHGAACAVDNTFVTPVFQRPLTYGVDYVVHAATKHMSGHADVLGGAVITADPERLESLRTLQWVEGAVPSPLDCWLTRRGLKTLPLRVRAQTATAQTIAEYLLTHPAVTAVHYPGLHCHPQHELATRILGGFGSIVSFQVSGGPQAAVAVAAGVRLFTRATSFGAIESLIQHQASAPTHGPGSSLPQNLLRLSIGLEHATDLIADLDQALAQLHPPLARGGHAFPS
ncbi:trans-sulfuration enzyme family protein [Nonomuraea sp. NPDC002799]